MALNYDIMAVDATVNLLAPRVRAVTRLTDRSNQ